MTGSPSMRTLLAEHLELARTLRRLEIQFDPTLCKGVWQCYEVCPVGCWTPNYTSHIAVFSHPEQCIACNACVLQCPEGAIKLEVPRD